MIKFRLREGNLPSAPKKKALDSDPDLLFQTASHTVTGQSPPDAAQYTCKPQQASSHFHLTLETVAEGKASEAGQAL